MSIVLRILAVVVVLVIGGALAFLMIWDPPPPDQPIDQPITKTFEP